MSRSTAGARTRRCSQEPSPRPQAVPPPPADLEAPAREACVRSQALGTRPPRGAALLTRSGHIFTAGELEDPPTSNAGACAERAAVFRAVVAGHRRFRSLLLRGGRHGRGDAGPPCGACLQVLMEFSPDLRVWWGTPVRPRGGVKVRQLLPGAFGAAHLDNDGDRSR